MLSQVRVFLTPRRLRYAWLLTAALWVAWLGSLALGPGLLDLAGQPVGTDFLQFYAAGRTLLRGDGARLYDMAYQSQLQQEIIGPGLTSYHAFITPPFLAWLFAPLALLPYSLSFVVWSLLGFLCLWSGLRLIGLQNGGNSLIWALAWFPVFAAISFGQNALLTFLLFSTAGRLWWRSRLRSRYLEAGLVLSLTTYKPQLALGIAVLWLLDIRRSWPALAGLAAGSGLLALLCFLLLPEASSSYVDFAFRVLPDLPTWQEFPIWHLHTVRGFWRLLLPWTPRGADALVGLSAVWGLWGFVKLWRSNVVTRQVSFAAAVALSLWLTPHAMIYDWVLLLIPGLLLWQTYPMQREHWRPLYALLWLATLVSGSLTYLQLQVLPVAIQLSVPAFAGVSLAIGRGFSRCRLPDPA